MPGQFLWLPSGHSWANSDVTWMLSIWLKLFGCNRQVHRRDSWLYSSQNYYLCWEFQKGTKQRKIYASKCSLLTKPSLECQLILSLAVVFYVLLYPGMADEFQQNPLCKLQWWEMWKSGPGDMLVWCIYSICPSRSILLPSLNPGRPNCLECTDGCWPGSANGEHQQEIGRKEEWGWGI